MRLPNSTSFQKVFQTVLYFVLESVDCGVAMSDAVNGEPCGHIIVSYRFHAVRHKIPGHTLSLLVIVCLLADGHAATGIPSGAEDPLESNYSLEALLDIQVRDKRTRIVQAMQN